MNGSENPTQNPAVVNPQAAATQDAASSAPTPAYPSPPLAQATVSGQDPRSKSPGLAGFLSLIPGLGQIYVGYYKRGFIHAGVIVMLITILANLRDDGLIPLFALPMVFFWLYNVIDATRRASLYNQYLAGEQEIDLPEDLTIPSFGGSVFGGLALITFGTALLLNTRFDVSFDWVEDWWPMGPILLGVYLLVKAIQERGGASSSAGSN